MATQDFKRKLTAILSADVKGYNRLMKEDEEATVRTITAYREVIGTIVQKHRGEVVDSPGDNILAEFASVVDAVRSAVEIQEELKARNAELPENRRMEFRIGINLGDVIHEEERIYGDGVNVAARVESLAEGGGICVSRSAYDQVKDKLTLGYEYLGEHSVKNIAEPVRIYRVLMDPEAAGRVIGEKRGGPKGIQRVALAAGIVLLLLVGGMVVWRTAFPPVEVASVEKMAFPLPGKPSIAVLPFENISDDPKQEYFSDGITEDLITDLAKISGLFVIARNSTFTYKGKPVKVQQVAMDLGVRYVLEGSVRKVGDQVRINAQLIDAIKGHHLWAERFDGQLGDIFALQDKFTQKIVAALAVKLTADDESLLASKGTDNVEAYDAYLQGWMVLNQETREGLVEAVRHLKMAVELDPNYSRAHAALARAYGYSMDKGFDLELGWSNARSLRDKHLQIAMKDQTPYTHRAVAKARLYQRKYEEAIAAAERAHALAPNDTDSQFSMARVLIFAGRPAEGLEFLHKAMRHNPNYPAWYLWFVGLAQFSLEQYEEAVSSYERLLKRNPKSSIWILAAAHAHLGRQQKAADVITKYGKRRGNLGPGVPVENMLKYFPFRESKDADRFIDGLLKAGLPRSWKLVYRGHYDEAIAKAEKAIGLNPNDAEAQFTMGETLIYAGRAAEAVGFIKKAMKINPKYPSYYLWHLGLGQFCMKQYKEALTSLEDYYKRKMKPQHIVPKWLLAATYAHLGQEQKAQEMLSKLIKKRGYYKAYSVEKVLRDNFYAFKNQENKDRLADGLRKAGLK
jgi:TolB-like protein/class 3 adenylate cyclase/cytochrome c-type biogenesis protein CcmH/NrfG